MRVPVAQPLSEARDGTLQCARLLSRIVSDNFKSRTDARITTCNAQAAQRVHWQPLHLESKQITRVLLCMKSSQECRLTITEAMQEGSSQDAGPIPQLRHPQVEHGLQAQICTIRLESTDLFF